MAGRKLEERIQELRELRTSATPADAVGALQKALGDRSNLIAAEAAKTAGELRLVPCVPAILAAFDRLFQDGSKTDPKCFGKLAIVRALVRMDYSESAPFLRGFRHIQMEAVYGGQEDSAPPLRANCALALVQCTDLTRVEVLRHLVDGLTDPADPVRIEAVRAVNQLGGDEAALLLRLKARTGDRRTIIIGHVFDALLNLETHRAVGFVAGYLDASSEEIRDEASLALGGSRLPAAVEVLIENWKQKLRPGAFAGVLLRAISSSRLPLAIEFLLQVVTTGTPAQSSSALEALKLHEHTPEIQAQVEQAMRRRALL